METFLALAYGMFKLPWWGYVLTTLVLTHITIAGVTIYLHRHQAHRALDLHPIVSHFFRLWLWLTTGMVTKAWTAIHRKHHAKVETEEDPHSPQVMGIRKVLLEGAELYRAEAKNQETLDKYGFGTPDDWLERKIYSRKSRLGVGIMLLVDVVLFGIPGVSIWAVQMMWIPFFAAGVINGVGHWWGYRNYETQDTASNIVPWGILIGGEELHNNHHAYASSAKLSSKWWEFDIGWLYIRALSALGLARVKKLAPKPVIDPAKSRFDVDTVRAIVTNRFQVMARYGKDVLARVHREEMGRADSAYRRLLRRGRRLLVREESFLDEASRQQLEVVLRQSSTLATVYRFKQGLQDIWARSAQTQDQLLHALQEWCHQAERTGINYLREFAQSLRGYTLHPA